MANQIKCAECGKFIRETSRFCPFCGATQKKNKDAGTNYHQYNSLSSVKDISKENNPVNNDDDIYMDDEDLEETKPVEKPVEKSAEKPVEKSVESKQEFTEHVVPAVSTVPVDMQDAEVSEPEHLHPQEQRHDQENEIQKKEADYVEDKPAPSSAQISEPEIERNEKAVPIKDSVPDEDPALEIESNESQCKSYFDDEDESEEDIAEDTGEYDPNHDHYYDDVKPLIQEEVKSKTREIVLKSIGAVAGLIVFTILMLLYV